MYTIHHYQQDLLIRLEENTRRHTMKKRIYTLATVLLITMLAVSPVYAGGVSIKIGLGSITGNGYAWGFGNDVTIVLSGAGVPVVTCAAPGNDNLAPGQNPARVSAHDSAKDTDDPNKTKGKFHFDLEAQPVLLSPVEMGCANNNWTATIDFVFWDTVTVSVLSNKTGKVLYQQSSTCVTTHDPDTISCPAFP
jgi:hypothetical protein